MSLKERWVLKDNDPTAVFIIRGLAAVALVSGVAALAHPDKSSNHPSKPATPSQSEYTPPYSYLVTPSSLVQPYRKHVEFKDGVRLQILNYGPDGIDISREFCNGTQFVETAGNGTLLNTSGEIDGNNGKRICSQETLAQENESLQLYPDGLEDTLFAVIDPRIQD